MKILMLLGLNYTNSLGTPVVSKEFVYDLVFPCVLEGTLCNLMKHKANHFLLKSFLLRLAQMMLEIKGKMKASIKFQVFNQKMMIQCNLL
jgi:hypothetical protein